MQNQNLNNIFKPNSIFNKSEKCQRNVINIESNFFTDKLRQLMDNRDKVRDYEVFCYINDFINAHAKNQNNEIFIDPKILTPPIDTLYCCSSNLPISLYYEYDDDETLEKNLLYTSNAQLEMVEVIKELSKKKEKSKKKRKSRYDEFNVYDKIELSEKDIKNLIEFLDILLL